MLDTPTHSRRNDTLALGVASIAPILFSIHIYGIETNAYAPGTVDRLILPAYLVMLSTSVVAAKLAFATSKSSESVTNKFAKLVSATSLVFLAIMAIPLFLLTDFGPS